MTRRVHIEIGHVVVETLAGRAAFEAALRREIERRLANGVEAVETRSIARIDGGIAKPGGEAAAAGAAIGKMLDGGRP